MSRNRLGLALAAVFALSAGANASSITISNSTYGKAISGGAICDFCVLPTDVTVLEQNYSDARGEVYDFEINSLPSDTTGYAFTVSGSTPLVSTSDFGAFVCSDLPKNTKTQCGVEPTDVTTNVDLVTTTVKSGRKLKTVTSADSVTFTVNGANTDLVFYAIYDPKAVITADLTLQTYSVPEVESAPFSLARFVSIPEPRFVSMLLAAVLFLGSSYLRRRRTSSEEHCS